MNDLGSRLHRLRKKRGYTLEELEERAGVSKSYIHDIENGKRKSPSISILRRLADALGVPLEVLLNFQAEEKYWITDLPPEIQSFVRDKGNIEYVKLSKKLKERNIDPQVIEKIIELLRDSRGEDDPSS